DTAAARADDRVAGAHGVIAVAFDGPAHASRGELDEACHVRVALADPLVADDDRQIIAELAYVARYDIRAAERDQLVTVRQLEIAIAAIPVNGHPPPTR